MSGTCLLSTCDTFMAAVTSAPWPEARSSSWQKIRVPACQSYRSDRLLDFDHAVLDPDVKVRLGHGRRPVDDRAVVQVELRAVAGTDHTGSLQRALGQRAPGMHAGVMQRVDLAVHPGQQDGEPPRGGPGQRLVR